MRPVGAATGTGLSGRHGAEIFRLERQEITMHARHLHRRRPGPSRLAALLGLLVACQAAGCAWSYAGEEGRTREELRTPQDTQVVRVEEATTPVEPTDAQSSAPAQSAEDDNAPPKAEAPCGRPSFTIHYYDATTRVTKEIDCASRAVINLTRTPIGDLGYQEAREANLPEGSWYLLVDPRGLRARYLNNDHLLKLSRLFDIEFFGRDRGQELLIYLFEGEVE